MHTISIYPTFPARGETNKRESASTFTFQIAEHALHDDVRSLRAGGASAAARASESADLDGGPGAVVPQSPIKSRLPSVHPSFTRHVGIVQNAHTFSQFRKRCVAIMVKHVDVGACKREVPAAHHALVVAGAKN